MVRAAYTVILAVFTVAATPATPSPTPPPQIYRVVSRPLCSELHEHIAPAIGMMLQNDTSIKKSPGIFKQYNIAALYGSDPSTSAGDPRQRVPGNPGDGTSNPAQSMALLSMENLIRPIANNIIAIQTLLDSPQLLKGTGRPEDDKQLKAIREQLLKALATQNASLDIISGFVDTQQMADLQHSGQEYIGSITAPDSQHAISPTPAPNPLTVNRNIPGLPQNPYNIELATIPGLTLGYNPITRLIDALNWTIEQTATRENDAAKTVMSSAALCGNIPTPGPSP
jgi:hypothetical protein